MNSFERIRAMVEGKPVDRSGTSAWVHMPLVDQDPIDFPKAMIDFNEDNGFDFVKIMYNGFYFTDDFGMELQFSADPAEWAPKVLRYVVNHPNDFMKLKVCDPKKGTLAREVEATKKIADHFKGKVPVLATMFTPITWAATLYDASRQDLMKNIMLYNQKELHNALKVINETNLLLADEFVKAGIDGIFYATQFACDNYVTDEQFEEFLKPYDLPVLEQIKKDTWFNILHIHGYRDLRFKEHLDYPVQAFNWEDVKAAKLGGVDMKKARAMTDKILIGGLDLDADLYSPNNDRNAVKEVLKARIRTAVEGAGKDKFIFAPGCSVPLDVPMCRYALLKECVEEVTGA